MKPKKPGRKKGSTETLVAARVEEVLHMRLAGAEFYDLKAHGREKKWRGTDRQLWRYVEAADALLAQAFEKDREKLLRRHVATRRSLYARALGDGDYRTALAIAKDEAELIGLYPGKTLKLTGPGGGPVQVETLTADERSDAIDRIAARFGLTAGSAGSAPPSGDGQTGAA